MNGSITNWDRLRSIVTATVKDATALKDKHTDQAAASVSYSAVFCRDELEYTDFTVAAEEHGELAQSTPTGPVFIVPAITTAGGPLRIVKIRRPDPTRTERGDADFALDDYGAFKASYLSRPGFRHIERDEFEMIELMDPMFDARAYFSNPPVEQHSGIREALERLMLCKRRSEGS